MPKLIVTLVLACLWSSSLTSPAMVFAEEPSLELQDGDRITLLGAGFVERLQHTGYLETVITTRRPNLNLTFRNLGWSGDTVWGEARGVFGGQAEGFKRLMSDLRLTDPTLILIAYGNNEAYAGEAGLPRFEQGLNQLLDQLATTQARLVLLSPLEREHLGAPLPDPAAYNQQVKRYAETIEQIANDRDLKYIELNPLAQRDAASRPAAADQRLTADSLTMTNYGTWLAAGKIASALGVESVPWEVTLDVAKQEAFAQGAVLTDFMGKESRWQFDLVAAQLPYPELPRHSPPGAEGQLERRQLAVKGLPAESSYRLLIEGQEVARGTQAQWAQGIALTESHDDRQTEHVRRLINTKNQLFFNRYRPQNETYLFLFRKHEQGNNAVEIPRFDPLIESKEHEIADWRGAKKRRYVLEKVR